MAAAVNGWVAMTRLLLERGADPNRRAPGGSVLDFGRRSGNAEVIELLLRAGAR
jgi:ankyrin repeat protein